MVKDTWQAIEDISGAVKYVLQLRNIVNTYCQLHNVTWLHVLVL